MATMIEIKNLAKSYGKLKALDNISVGMQKGQVISLLGPNGSGKTTLIKSILGLAIPERGEIKINGRLIGRDWEYRSEIGYMPQTGRYPENMTAGQIIAMIKSLRKDCCLYNEELPDGFGFPLTKNKKKTAAQSSRRQKTEGDRLAGILIFPVYLYFGRTHGRTGSRFKRNAESQDGKRARGGGGDFDNLSRIERPRRHCQPYYLFARGASHVLLFRRRIASDERRRKIE